MRPTLVPLVLALSALPVAGQEPLCIEGLAGRVEALAGGELPRILTGLGPRTFAGPGHLEVGSLAETRLSWPARASLGLAGRTGLEWSPGGETRLRVFELEHGELEVRRGALLCELPWNWNASFAPGAFRLRSLPGGALEIETVAGTAPRVWWSAAGLLRCVAGPRAGERLVLPSDWSDEPRAKRESRTPWPEVVWPWTPSAPAPVPEPASAAPAPAPVPVVPESPRIEVPRAELPEIEVAPAAVAAPLPPPYDPALWGGHAREDLERLGAIVAERRPDLAWQSDGHGGGALRLRSDAPRSASVFRAGSDLELEPGTLVLFDAEGRLQASLGRLAARPAPPGRPRPPDAGFALRP